MKTLVNGEQKAGSYKNEWDSKVLMVNLCYPVFVELKVDDKFTQPENCYF